MGNLVINGLNIASPVIKGAVAGALGGALGGYTGTLIATGIQTGSLKAAHRAGLKSLYLGAGIGALVGGVSAYRAAKAEGVNPWSGKPKDAVMIGGGQSRVDSFAKDLSSETISDSWPEGLDPYSGRDIPNPMAEDFNQNWIDKVMNNNKTILDIGPVKDYSPFYNGIELNSIQATGYQNVINMNTTNVLGLRILRWRN